MVFLLSLFSPPFSVSALSQHLQPPLLPPSVHHKADGIPAHTRTKLLHIGDAKGVDHTLEHVFHQIGFGAAFRPLPFSPLLEFTVGPPPDRKKICEPRYYIMAPFKPIHGTGFQSFVIILLGLLHNPLKADVSPDFMTVVVAQKQR